jgi:hypothetical protein
MSKFANADENNTLNHFLGKAEANICKNNILNV